MYNDDALPIESQFIKMAKEYEQMLSGEYKRADNKSDYKLDVSANNELNAMLKKILKMECALKSKLDEFKFNEYERHYNRSLSHTIYLKEWIIESLKELTQCDIEPLKAGTRPFNIMNGKEQRELIESQLFIMEKYDYALKICSETEQNALLKLAYWSQRCYSLLKFQ